MEIHLFTCIHIKNNPHKRFEEDLKRNSATILVQSAGDIAAIIFLLKLSRRA